MDCPRCDEDLSIYVAEGTGAAAVVCDTCGFADVSTSHTADRTGSESWDRALERFDTSTLTDQRLRQTTRGETVSIPFAEPVENPAEPTQRADSVETVSLSAEDAATSQLLDGQATDSQELSTQKIRGDSDE